MRYPVLNAKIPIRAGPRMKNNSLGSQMFKLRMNGRRCCDAASRSGCLSTAIKGKIRPMLIVSNKAPRTIAPSKTPLSILSCGVRMYQSCLMSSTCPSQCKPYEKRANPTASRPYEHLGEACGAGGSRAPQASLSLLKMLQCTPDGRRPRRHRDCPNNFEADKILDIADRASRPVDVFEEERERHTGEKPG